MPGVWPYMARGIAGCRGGVYAARGCCGHVWIARAACRPPLQPQHQTEISVTWPGGDESPPYRMETAPGPGMWVAGKRGDAQRKTTGTGRGAAVWF